MKGKLAFDPREYDYGPATPRVRALLALSEATDWFVAPVIAAADAEELFREHHALCERLRPDLFPSRVAIEHVIGDWADFRSQCAQVRHPVGLYDWKYSALKPMAHHHKRAHGFEPAAYVGLPATARPGDLFLPLAGVAIYNPIAPRVDLRTGIPEPAQEAAAFYWGYAATEVSDAIVWEIADPAAPIGSNPFELLLRCYAAGYYPFARSPDHFVLFCFARGELPVARVVR